MTLVGSHVGPDFRKKDYTLKSMEVYESIYGHMKVYGGIWWYGRPAAWGE